MGSVASCVTIQSVQTVMSACLSNTAASSASICTSSTASTTTSMPGVVPVLATLADKQDSSGVSGPVVDPSLVDDAALLEQRSTPSSTSHIEMLDTQCLKDTSTTDSFITAPPDPEEMTEGKRVLGICYSPSMASEGAEGDAPDADQTGGLPLTWAMSSAPCLPTALLTFYTNETVRAMSVPELASLVESECLLILAYPCCWPSICGPKDFHDFSSVIAKLVLGLKQMSLSLFGPRGMGMHPEMRVIQRRRLQFMVQNLTAFDRTWKAEGEHVSLLP